MVMPCTMMTKMITTTKAIRNTGTKKENRNKNLLLRTSNAFSCNRLKRLFKRLVNYGVTQNSLPTIALCILIQ